MANCQPAACMSSSSPNMDFKLGNNRLSCPHAIHTCDCFQYQSAPVVLPAEVVHLKARLARLQQQLTVDAGGAAPSTSDLATAAGLSVAKVQQVMQAAQMQVGRQGQLIAWHRG